MKTKVKKARRYFSKGVHCSQELATVKNLVKGQDGVIAASQRTTKAGGGGGQSRATGGRTTLR